MKTIIRLRLFWIVLLSIFCTACQPTVVLTLTHHPSLDVAGTATLPQETPVIAPTDISIWSLSPNQQLMVAQTHDGAWWVWDAASHLPLYLLQDTPLRAPPIYHPTFSPNGYYLVAISMGHIVLWEVASRKRRLLMPPLTQDDHRLHGLVFSPDSHLLVTSSCEQQNSHSVCKQGFVSLWNTNDGILARTLPTGFRVNVMTFNSDGNTLTVTGCSRTIGTNGNDCYEQSQASFNISNGERIAITRVPQRK